VFAGFVDEVVADDATGAAAVAAAGAAYCTDVTWLMGYVRASPVEDCSEIAELELLVTVPLKVEPSVNVTVACWAGAGALLQPHSVARATTITSSTFIGFLQQTA
jgi:hypothetical protein